LSIIVNDQDSLVADVSWPLIVYALFCRHINYRQVFELLQYLY
jgi:hypothetical protein